MSENFICPKCGEGCARGEVHNGVAVLYGPWGCGYCGWSENSAYDVSEGPKITESGYKIDQLGGATPIRAIQTTPPANATEAVAKPVPEMPVMKTSFVIDVESIGLHGEPYAVGYVVIDESGNELLARRLAIFPQQAHGDEDDREWVEQNIPPIPLSHESMEDMLDEFWKDWLIWKEQGALMFAECAWPVEAKFLAMCAGRNWPANKWQRPYPLHEIASIMLAAGMDPMATYERTELELPKHDPLADARQSARLLAQARATRAAAAPLDSACKTCDGTGQVPAMVETATGLAACPYLGEACPDCAAPPTAQPTPSGPTAGRDPNYHDELKASNAENRRLNEQLNRHAHAVGEYCTGAPSVPDALRMMRRQIKELGTDKVDLRAALAAAETKASEYGEEIKRLHWNMREAETQARTLAEELEVVTQSRNKYQSDYERVDTENMALLTKAGAMDREKRRLEDGIRAAIDIATGHGERTPYLYNVEEALRKLLHPPAPSVASEKEGRQ